VCVEGRADHKARVSPIARAYRRGASPRGAGGGAREHEHTTVEASGLRAPNCLMALTAPVQKTRTERSPKGDVEERRSALLCVGLRA